MSISRIVIPASGGRNAFTLYAELANINYFLKTPVTASDVANFSNKQVTVKAHTRRRYPGDTAPINVSTASREFLVDPTRKSGNGLPGRTVVLVGDMGLPGEERRAVTLKGRWIDFHSWLVSNAKMQIVAYNNTGANSTIDAATTQTP